MSVMQADRYW